MGSCQFFRLPRVTLPSFSQIGDGPETPSLDLLDPIKKHLLKRNPKLNFSIESTPHSLKGPWTVREGRAALPQQPQRPVRLLAPLPLPAGPEAGRPPGVARGPAAEVQVAVAAGRDGAGVPRQVALPTALRTQVVNYIIIELK